MMDHKTYNDLMNIIIKGNFQFSYLNLAEVKRIERDKLQQSQIDNNFSIKGQMPQKRPNSTLKRLGPLQQLERQSNPARVIYQNQAAFFYP